MPRRILVTGGNRGIGRAIALLFAAAGDQVAITGRDADALATVTAEASNLAGSVTGWSCDVTDPAGVAATVASIADSFGGLDVVVNNAGISRLTPIAGGPEADEAWERVIATNLSGPWWVTRAAVPHLSEGGRIIMISSVLGRLGHAGYAAYSASKHGLIGMVRCLALELAPRRITVNAVAPGWVETDLLEAGFAELAVQSGHAADVLRRAAKNKTPLGQYIHADDVAALVAYVASPEASGMTAQVLGIDGGLTPHA